MTRRVSSFSSIHFVLTTLSCLLLQQPSSAQVVFSEFLVDNYTDGTAGLHAADLDGDGDLDLVGAAASDNEIVWQLRLKNIPVGKNPGWFYKAQRICR